MHGHAGRGHAHDVAALQHGELPLGLVVVVSFLEFEEAEQTGRQALPPRGGTCRKHRAEGGYVWSHSFVVVVVVVLATFSSTVEKLRERLGLWDDTRHIASSPTVPRMSSRVRRSAT